jgi:hypothetical protein
MDLMLHTKAYNDFRKMSPMQLSGDTQSKTEPIMAQDVIHEDLDYINNHLTEEFACLGGQERYSLPVGPDFWDIT